MCLKETNRQHTVDCPFIDLQLTALSDRTANLHHTTASHTLKRARNRMGQKREQKGETVRADNQNVQERDR